MNDPRIKSHIPPPATGYRGIADISIGFPVACANWGSEGKGDRTTTVDGHIALPLLAALALAQRVIGGNDRYGIAGAGCSVDAGSAFGVGRGGSCGGVNRVWGQARLPQDGLREPHRRAVRRPPGEADGIGGTGYRIAVPAAPEVIAIVTAAMLVTWARYRATAPCILLLPSLQGT